MIHSIGHSTLTKEQFLRALKGVPTVIDIRSHPGSKWPQFRKEELEVWLPGAGVAYEWEPRLGGWDKRHLPLAEGMARHGVDVACYARGKFPKQRISVKTLPGEDDARQEFLPIVKPSWTNQGLYDYSFFMTLPEFLEAADELAERGSREDVAIMCCEGPYYKCHRSMVSDYLVRLGADVRHLPGTKTHSQMLGNRLERYDETVVAAWDRWVAGP